MGTFNNDPGRYRLFEGRLYFLEETVHGAVERDEARHDFHHERLYVRTVPLGNHRYAVYCAEGLPYEPSCCRVKPMVGMGEVVRFEVRQSYTFDQVRIHTRKKAAARLRRRRREVAAS